MELVETPDRLTFSIRMREDTYTVEELLSMVFEMARKMSDTFGRTQIRDCVVTIPPSYTRAQRILLMQTAQAAGLNVVSLMHENTAAALYYGIDRVDNETAHYAIFYNMGASKTQVSVVKYTALERPVQGVGNKTIEHIEVLSHTCNDQIGGRTFDSLIANHIADEFQRLHNLDPKGSKKTMLRVMNHANKVKKVLSANKVAFVHDDSLYQGKAISYGVQREVLDELIAAKAKELLQPIDTALQLANLTIDSINSFEIIGGVTRIPKVQELLKTYNTNRDLGMHLNGDEAMAHGAALFAANYSLDLFVKPMWLSDVLPYSVSAEFWSPDDPEFTKSGTVFKIGTRLNAKKQLTFSFDKRIVCRLIAKYPSHEAILDEYGIADIPEVAANYSQTPLNVFTFGVDMSGVPFLYLVHSELEVDIEQEVPDVTDENQTESFQNETETESTQNSLLTGKRKEKVKLKFAPYSMELPIALNKTEVEFISTKLTNFTKQEKERLKLAESRSELEGYIYYLREKLDEETFILVTTESERSELESLLAVESGYLDSPEFHTATSDELLKRKSAIRSTVFDALDREEEMAKRPKAVDETRKKLMKFRETAVSYNQTMPWVEESLIEAAFSAVKESEAWLEGRVKDQEAKQPWESPAFRTAELSWKLDTVKIALDAIKRVPKPKPPVFYRQKKEKKETKTEESGNKEEKTSEEGEKIPEEEVKAPPEEAEQVVEEKENVQAEAEEPLELPANTDL